jgi:hypothetical protein
MCEGYVLTQCAFTDCEQKAVHKITDATADPKVWNGKMICEEHQLYRELLKKEPEDEEESK